MLKKIATQLLSFQNPKIIKKRKVIYALFFVVVFSGHSYFSNMESPLKLIPQTMCAFAMGIIYFSYLSIKNFKYLGEFIDWEKVTETVEQRQSKDADS